MAISLRVGKNILFNTGRWNKMNLELNDFVVNDELVINEKEWENLNNDFSRGEIKYAISEVIKDLPLPYAKISKQEAFDDFQKLVNLDSREIAEEGSWFSRYEYKYDFNDVYLKTCNTGNKSSNYFHQANRWKCDSINSPSPERTWNTEKFRMTLLNGLWSQKVKRIDSKILRQCIALRKYIASQFRPSVAKHIYETFGSKSVLDFSSGWGDRLAGFYASEKTEIYRGIDPNQNLIDGYSQQVNMYENLKKKQTLLSFGAAAEDAYIGDMKFDTVFTSPPYFRVERYTKEDNQSWVRYKKLEEWLDKFLFTTLQKSWDHLETGGHLIINISDVYMNHCVNHICDPMNNFIENKLKGKNFSCIGYQMQKRINSKSDKKGIFAEPVWIWQKL